MNPMEDAWLALKAAGRYGPVGGSKTYPTYSQGPLSNRHPRVYDPMGSGVAQAGGPGEEANWFPPEPEPEPEPEPLRPHQEGQYRPDAEDAMWGQLLEQWLARQQHGR